MKSNAVKFWLLFSALSLVWGSTWIASDTLTESVPPLRGSAVRFLLAALLCFPLIVWKRMPLPRGRALSFIFLLSATMVALPFLLLLAAKEHTSSATITVLFAAMPLVVALMTPGKVPQRAIQSMIVTIGTIAWVAGAYPSWRQAGGAALALLAVVSVGASSLMARRELGRVPPLMVTALLTATAGVTLLVAGLVLERGEPAQWNQQAVVSVICLGAVAGAPAYAAYFWLLQQREAYQVATLEWTAPLIAMAESAFFLRIGLSYIMIAGSLVTLVCVLLVLRSRAEDDDNVSLLGT